MTERARELRVGVVGARRQRQGTGEYLARAFAKLGCRVDAIVGTSPATLEEARRGLRERQGLETRGYLSVPELLARERPDVLVIASPAEHHLPALEAALEAGCHVFCEKPLFWSEGLERDDAGVAATTERLVALARSRGRLLGVNTQWPETLDAFRTLHPRALEAALASVEMWLSPMSLGPSMVVDSAPHLLSLVHALAGPGELQQVAVEARTPDSLHLAFGYRHAGGLARCALHLKQCPEPPRPAAYAVNGARVDRAIELPGYRLSLVAGSRRQPLEDPLDRCVARFLRDLEAGAATQDFPLVPAMSQLARLVSAVVSSAAAGIMRGTMRTMTDDAKGSEPKKQTELAPVHDFAAKLCQPSVLERLKSYVRWQSDWRRARAQGRTLDSILSVPDQVPLSINLDLTTACNYACDHCVDMDILNTGVQYDHVKLMSSLAEMAKKGLRSVIVIGGGEPTVYPKFAESIRHMKSLGLKLGIVTNGSGMEKIGEVADVFDAQDWVRLSLDSGSNEVFEAMHKPKGKMFSPKGKIDITLDGICDGVARVKQAHPGLRIGYSFIIVWKDCEANDAAIHENVHEIVMGAERARRSGFDYISFKPFLTRAEKNNAEIVGLTKESTRIEDVMLEIRKQVDLAKKLETETFKVLESTNLKVLENGTYQNYTNQPRNCHMQFFRQVLSPLGVFNCPVYRHVPQAKVGEKHSYADLPSLQTAQRSTLRLIETFDAREECKEVTCLYNHVNWFLEDLIEHPEKLDSLQASPERNDFFL